MAAPTTLPDTSVLLSIINTARRVQGHLRNAGFKPSAPNLQAQFRRPASSSSSLDFPFPHDIVECVQRSATALPIQERIIARIGQWYEEVRSSLRTEYMKTLARVDDIPQPPGQSVQQRLHDVYESLFKQKASKFRSDIEHALRRAAANSRIAAQKEKRRTPFNHECLPLLETYFEYNAYPSAQDRALLARKTMMCSRQVEVWFQNHRRRAKKEGRQLRRLSQDPLPRELGLENLNAPIPLPFVAKDEMEETPLKRGSPSPKVVIPEPPEPVAQAVDVLCALAPAYAFPTKYPPTPHHKPCLGSPKSWSFPPPVWPRRASVKTPLRKATITPNELAVEIQKKLSIAGSDGVERPRTTFPVWYPIITVPFGAPHFALVRKSTPSPLPRSQTTPRESPAPRPSRKKTSPLTNHKRPSPYQPRRLQTQKPLGRTASNSSLCSTSSSSGESEIRTPSPSPLPRYISLTKEASIPPQYPDWEAYLLPP